MRQLLTMERSSRRFASRVTQPSESRPAPRSRPSRRSSCLGRFSDALGEACERAGCARMPTMVVQDLMSAMLAEGSGDEDAVGGDERRPRRVL